MDACGSDPHGRKYETRRDDFEGGRLETERAYYRIDGKEISYLRFIFEAYDGIAALTTIDPEAGLICLLIPPGCRGEVEAVIRDLRTQFRIEPAFPRDFELGLFPIP